MAEGPKFTIRPVSRQPKNDSREVFRVYMSPASLLHTRLRIGEPCQLQLDNGPPKTAIAWSAAEKIHDNVVQTSKVLQTLYGFKLGDKVTVTQAREPLASISTVHVEECSGSLEDLAQNDLHFWEWALEHPLLTCEILTMDMTIECELKGCRRSFKIAGVNVGLGHGENTIARFTSESKVNIGPMESTLGPKSGIGIDMTGLAGFDSQIEQINERLRDFTTEAEKIEMPSYFRSSGGILIYGSKGTGKTSLLCKLEQGGWRSVFPVKSSIVGRSKEDGETKLRKIFSDALKSQPSIVSIDQLDFIAPKRGTNDALSLGSVLSECLDSLQYSQVLVVACTRHPNDVDDTLRTPHRLGIEIELQVPTKNDRAEILKALRGSATQPCDTILEKMAAQTHGYVGADLVSLLQLSCRKAQTRQLSDLSKETSTSDERQGDVGGIEKRSTVSLQILEEDVALALKETRPTAMREVFLETPAIRWADVGGQSDVKKFLQRAVERPLKFPDRMKRFNVSGKKGVLLFGPPGCSKTLLVKALATEAGLNFLAVKGAEILSMYVGESERAMREVFRKARAARPSIIFFDEIDAIAGRRGPGVSSGVNVLTTLLNEMDGIEELKNVLVIAATNKPDTLDPALMRPGRLDTILYIGLPDLQARKELLEVWFKKSRVHQTVDSLALAERTEGYSGAELVSICETAAEAAFDEAEELGHEVDINAQHFDRALDTVPKQISMETINEYEAWSSQFGTALSAGRQRLKSSLSIE